MVNTGTIPIENPPTVVTYGRGEDPTDLLVRPDLGAIAPGQTTEVRIPFELPAGSFGSYTVKTTIGGLDQPTAARASTSTYPWFLLVGIWLLIQIPLLGLHKRRVDDGELFDESELLELDDPFRGLVPAAPVGALAAAGAVSASAPAGAGTDAVPGWASAATGLAAGAAVAAGAATAVLDRPCATPTATDAGLPAWAAAAVAPEAVTQTPATPTSAVPAAPVTAGGAPSAVAAIAAAMGGAALTGAGAAAATADPGGSGRGGYGVDHLLGIVSPGTAAPPPATVAARVVVASTTPKR